MIRPKAMLLTENKYVKPRGGQGPEIEAISSFNYGADMIRRFIFKRFRLKNPSKPCTSFGGLLFGGLLFDCFNTIS